MQRHCIVLSSSQIMKTFLPLLIISIVLVPALDAFTPASSLGEGKNDIVELLPVPFEEAKGSVGTYEDFVKVILPPGYYSKKLDQRKLGISLVLCLHGYGGDIDEHRLQYGIGRATKKTKIIQVYAAGRKDNQNWRYWSAFKPDWTGACKGFIKCKDTDVEYLRTVVKTAMAFYNINPKRIYVYGHSNGAAMAYRIACDASDLFAAAVAVEGAPPHDGGVHDNYKCAPQNPISILHIGGSKDNNVKFEGYGYTRDGIRLEKKAYLSAAASVEKFARLFKCQETALPEAAHLAAPSKKKGPRMNLSPRDKGKRETEVYALKCRKNIDIQLWKITTEGHNPKLNWNYQKNLVKWLSKRRKIAAPKIEVRDTSACKTQSGSKCVFPFTYEGVAYTGCVTIDSENGQPWCGTQKSVPPNSMKGWDYCDELMC